MDTFRKCTPNSVEGAYQIKCAQGPGQLRDCLSNSIHFRRETVKTKGRTRSPRSERGAVKYGLSCSYHGVKTEHGGAGPMCELLVIMPVVRHFVWTPHIQRLPSLSYGYCFEHWDIRDTDAFCQLVFFFLM